MTAQGVAAHMENRSAHVVCDIRILCDAKELLTNDIPHGCDSCLILPVGRMKRPYSIVVFLTLYAHPHRIVPGACVRQDWRRATLAFGLVETQTVRANAIQAGEPGTGNTAAG